MAYAITALSAEPIYQPAPARRFVQRPGTRRGMIRLEILAETNTAPSLSARLVKMDVTRGLTMDFDGPAAGFVLLEVEGAPDQVALVRRLLSARRFAEVAISPSRLKGRPRSIGPRPAAPDQPPADRPGSEAPSGG
jgi:hypothetical protein